MESLTDLKQASEPRFNFHEPTSTGTKSRLHTSSVCVELGLSGARSLAHSDSIHQHGQRTSLCRAFTAQDGVQLTS